MKSTEEILQRREKVRKFLIEGFSQVSIAAALKVSTRTIYSDVKAIRREIRKEIKGDQREAFLFDFMLKYDDIYRKANHTYNTAPTAQGKVGALRIMQAHFKEKKDILQSLGLIAKEPDRMEVTGDALTVAAAQKLLDEREKKRKAEQEPGRDDGLV